MTRSQYFGSSERKDDHEVIRKAFTEEEESDVGVQTCPKQAVSNDYRRVEEAEGVGCWADRIVDSAAELHAWVLVTVSSSIRFCKLGCRQQYPFQKGCCEDK